MSHLNFLLTYQSSSNQGFVAVAVRLKYGKYNRPSRLKGRLFAVSRRQRKDKKRKQKRLERVPEKLQRKRDRQERQRTRRMPRWIRVSLVVILISIIISGGIWIWWIQQPPYEPAPPPTGEVYVLQKDTFYVNINDTGQVQIDFMVGRYGGGTFGGSQPLNVSIRRTFDQTQVNFTLIEPYVFYDYFGNAYHIPPEVGANSLEFRVDNIYPNMYYLYQERKFRGGSTMRGYYSLLWDYILNSSDNSWLQTDTMDDMYTFTFDIHPENDTLPFNTPTIVHCNITFNTLIPEDTNVYNFGESKLLFPKQVFNDTTLLANITIHDVHRVGSIIDQDFSSYTIDNETHIGFQANPITTSMSQNQSWGYTFDLNVTSFTNASFCLLDLTTPENEFFMQSGATGAVEEQELHFPKADLEILTPITARLKMNFTDIVIRFPKICLDNGTIYYQMNPNLFDPYIPVPTLPIWQETNPTSSHSIEGSPNNSSDLDLQTLTWILKLRQFILIR